jgi:hypothetical protein
MGLNCRRKLSLYDDVKRMDDTWHITEDCKNDVDPKVLTQPLLQEYPKWW